MLEAAAIPVPFGKNLQNIDLIDYFLRSAAPCLVSLTNCQRISRQEPKLIKTMTFSDAKLSCRKRVLTASYGPPLTPSPPSSASSRRCWSGPSPTRRWPEHELAGGRCGDGGASWPRGRGVPRGAAALLLDRVRGAAGQGAAAVGVALCLPTDAAGGGGNPNASGGFLAKIAPLSALVLLVQVYYCSFRQNFLLSRDCPGFHMLQRSAVGRCDMEN